MTYTDEEKEEYRYEIYKGGWEGYRAKLVKGKNFGFVRPMIVLTEQGPRRLGIPRNCVREDREFWGKGHPGQDL